MVPAASVLSLPAALERQIRTASVQPHIRSLFSHLPEVIALEARVPKHDGVPQAALQLLKAALISPQLVLAAVHEGELEIVARRGDRRLALRSWDLAGDIRGVVRRILGALFDESDHMRVLEGFALSSSRLATLRTVVNRMLQAADMSEAHWALLCGVTSGYGLGFNRAALFTRDEATGAFVGAKAVGPGDEQEAHRIWADCEYHDMDVEAQIAGYSEACFASRYQRFVAGRRLAPGAAPGDEVAAALASAGPVAFRAERPVNEGLRELGCAGEFIVAALGARGEARGLLVADNLYSRAPVAAEDLAHAALYLDQAALVWENLLLYARVQELARVDGLTGVLNRREFEARFEEERSRATRSHQPCGLMLLDVDHFKLVNDERGHAAGDEVLRQLGALLKRGLRTHDLLGRFGGDEFVAFLPETTKDQLRATARRLGGMARAAGIEVSIGGACWPVDCDEPGALLGVADANLYGAKRAGRGRACLSGSGPVEFDGA